MASPAQPTSTSPSKSHPLLLYLCAYLFVLYILYTRLNLYLTRRRMKLDNNCQPCPHRLNKDPILGLDILRQNLNNAANKKILEVTYNRFLRFSSYTIQSRIMTMPLIITIEPENVKTILSTKFKDYSFGARNKAFGPLLGTGIFNSDGERWANSRHLLRPNFVREQVADLAMLERHYRIMRKWIPERGTTVDVQDLFFKLTIDTATEFLFAHSTNSLKMMPGLDGKEAENEDTVFAKAFTFAQEDVVTRSRLGFLDRFRRNKEGKEAIRICHEYVDKWVADAVRIREQLDNAEKGGRGQEERYVFIQELAKQTKDKKRIRDEVMNILLAGRDTTASLLSNMFFEIAKRPEIWKKLREEVEVLGGRAPTYEELRGLKYLKWCLNESLRLNPVVPGNSRYAIRDTILPLGGGPSGTSPLFIPRGTLIGYSVYSMHRRTDFFGPDALEFRPERWESLRPGWEYLPFNGGPRICLGQQYALTEASYVTCRLVQEFGGLESRSETGVWREGLTLTCCSGDGVKVGFVEG
ncbi:cytochrome P450 alkane hydroxylase-like protein [Clohesyomyces aquaticus]|uniref:Cytochrome P450 alkane hydroxylase-like protein n=1 Tax=Clohesyomyces aquaticus TaxID=1231657 RepID=A0A1Y2A5S5_9PLEO|nr:cytochrome P450 alkane hydroxylase-like protein [Clohesyomyces aquaticus]